jgi:hypothetical protein
LSLARRDVRALVAGGTVVLVALAANGVPTWYAWTASSRAAADLAVSDLAAARQAVTMLPLVRDSLTVRRTRFADLADGLLLANNPGTAAADLGALVASAAQAAGLAVGPITVRSDTSTAHVFARPTAHGDARGDVSGLVQFLLLLEVGPPLLTVKQLIVTQTDPGGPTERPEELRVEFVIEALALARIKPQTTLIPCPGAEP